MLRLASSLFVAKIVGMHSVGTSSFATIAVNDRSQRLESRFFDYLDCLMSPVSRALSHETPPAGRGDRISLAFITRRGMPFLQIVSAQGAFR